MLHINRILILLLTLAVATSCTEVIDVELNDSNPQLVIEGILTDQPTGNAVTLTESGSYSNPGTYPTVSGATVILKDDSGQTTLSEVEPGMYAFPEPGQAGVTYELEVQLDGETYSGVSTLPNSVPLDSLIFIDRPSNPFFTVEGTYVLTVEFDDPPGEDTYIFGILEVNGEQVSSALYEDSRTDGTRQQLVFFDAVIDPGDQVTVIAQAMDRTAYDYFNELAEIIGIGFGASTTAPANPNSNLSNKAIGYFGAFGETRIAGVAP